MLQRSSSIQLFLTRVVIGALVLSAISQGNSLGETDGTFTSYHIGNSLTWDTRVGEELPALGAPGYDSAVTGYHIYCASSLTDMVESPSSVCVSPHPTYGTYSSALSGFKWDAITLQPYSGPTAGAELNSAKTMIEMARQNPENHDTSFYVHSTWPSASTVGGIPTINMPDLWLDTSVQHSITKGMTHSRSYYNFYMNELRQMVPEADIFMVPVGDVILALDTKFRAGAYDGIHDVSELWRDYRHLNNVGRYVAMVTAWSTMHKADPSVLPWDLSFNPSSSGQNLPATEQLSILIRETVWEVVAGHPLSGVPAIDTVPGDYNSDGMVDAADYTLWRNQLGQVGVGLEADGNGDGFVDQQDYGIWKQNFGAASPTALTPPLSVPEPLSLIHI